MKRKCKNCGKSIDLECYCDECKRIRKHDYYLRSKKIREAMKSPEKDWCANYGTVYGLFEKMTPAAEEALKQAAEGDFRAFNRLDISEIRR